MQVEGNRQVRVEGNGQVRVEGNGQVRVEGNGQVRVEGNGQVRVEGNGQVRVELVYADSEREILVGFDVRPGSTVLDCVESSGLFRLVPELRSARLGFAVFGRRAEPADPVSKGDRIEVLRPLVIDPKEARRSRARRAGGSRPRPNRARPGSRQSSRPS